MDIYLKKKKMPIDKLNGMLDNYLGIMRNIKPMNYFEKRAIIPLLTSKLYDDLIEENDGKIPNKNLITWEIDTRDAQSRNPMNALIVSSTGTGKSRLVKNIIKYYWKLGYKILFIEPKSFEFVNANKMGKGIKIHPLDKNESLPIVSYSPSFTRYKVKRFTYERLKETNFYSHDLSRMVEPEIWESFGIPKKVADAIIGIIKAAGKKKLTIQNFIDMLKKMNIMANTMTAARGALENLQSTEFFSNMYNEIPLKKEWDKNNIICINYHNHKGINTCSDLGIILDMIMELGIQESRKGLKNVTKKLLVFDDSFFYTGPYALKDFGKGTLNLAVQNIGHCQNNARTWGVDTILITQNSSNYFIDPILVDSPTYILCSQVPNAESLRDKIPGRAYKILTDNDEIGGENLSPAVSPEEARAYHYPWIFAKNKYSFQIGYPFDVTVGHT